MSYSEQLKDGKFLQQHYTILLVYRYLFAFILGSLNEFSLMGYALIVMEGGMIFYLFFKKPYRNNFSSVMAVFNEVLIFNMVAGNTFLRNFTVAMEGGNWSD